MHAKITLFISVLIGLFFLGPGIIELTQWRRHINQFVAFGYPPYWPVVTFALKIVGGALAIFPATRLPGLVLCMLISAAAIGTVLIKGSKKDYPTVPINLIVLGLGATVILLSQ